MALPGLNVGHTASRYPQTYGCPPDPSHFGGEAEVFGSRFAGEAGIKWARAHAEMASMFCFSDICSSKARTPPPNEAVSESNTERLPS
eukprot:3939899-Rhodomonas_salina.1